ncbi:MAG: hypothetical protein M3Q29_10105 [Chloroflexota bacterium]|nr:hypothetical protein [Chloroflexota bacterium]
MDPQTAFCHNEECPARGKTGEGNIKVHSPKEKRYKCKTCGKTFAETKGTPMYRLHKPVEVFFIVMVLLSHGCPVQAIVAAFGLDERTVANWLLRTGKHCEEVQEHLVRDVESGCVQADELWVRMVGRRVWMAMAMAVPSRLWLGGAVSEHRDRSLVGTVARMVRAAALSAGVLVMTDGLRGYVKAFQRARVMIRVMDRDPDREPRTELGRKLREHLGRGPLGGGPGGSGDDDRLSQARARREEARARRDRQDYVSRVHAPVLRLLRDPDPDRLLAAGELEALIRVAQEQGWEPREMRDSTSAAGYEGTGLRHHRDHVALSGEWPTDFSPREYDASIRRVIGASDTAIYGAHYVDPHDPRATEDPRVIFHASTLTGEGGELGPNGRDYIVVTYSLREARWKTTFQTDEPAEDFMHRRIWRGARLL